MRRLARLYFPPLPRAVTTLQVGVLVNAFGNGVVLPFLFIYLHNVRGMGVAVAGLIIATYAALSLVTGPIYGTLIDRVGGKIVLATSLVILALGFAAFALVRDPWEGFVVAAVSGIGAGGFWPAQSTLIASLTPHDQMPSAFAMQRVVMNLGMGLGALSAGLIADTDRPGTFVALFLVDAATFLVYAGIMLAFVPSPRHGGSAHAPGRSGSYRDVVRHGAFVAVIGLNAVLIFAGFSGFDVLPVYAKNFAGITETQIGAFFFVNTLVVVLAQLPIARLAGGHRRMPTFALVGLVWAAAWLVVPLAGASSATAAFWLLTTVMVLFALGQCLHGAVAAPLVADLAAPHLLGRYMTLNALSWQAGFALGPALGGIGLALSPTGVWLAASAFCALGALLALAIEGSIPQKARRTPLPAPA